MDWIVCFFENDQANGGEMLRMLKDGIFTLNQCQIIRLYV